MAKNYSKDKNKILEKILHFSEKYDQECFLYVYDKKEEKVLHFATCPDFNQNDIFSQNLNRQFLSKDDKMKILNSNQEFDCLE